MADILDPSLDLSKPAGAGKSFAVKQMARGPFQNTSLSVRKQAWEDTAEFLKSIRKVLFSSKTLPESMGERWLFAPQIGAPEIRPAGLIGLGLSEESQQELRSRFLFIEDIYHFIWQIWNFSLEETPLLEKKIAAAVKNSNSADPTEQAAWKERGASLREIFELLTKDVESLRSKLEVFRFEEGRQRFTREDEDQLLILRTTHAEEGDFKNSLETLVKFSEKMSVEAGLDLAELPEKPKEETPAEATAEEAGVTDLAVAETVAAALTDAEPASESSDVGGDATEAPAQTAPNNQPPPASPPPPPRPQTPPQSQPVGVSPIQDLELNNLKTITIETERLSRIFLYQLAAQYDLPPELLQDDVSGFRDTIREDMRQWIVKKLRAGELDELYNPNAIRERQLLVASFGEVLSRDGRFDLFQKILIKHHERLNTDPIQQAAFKDELTSGKFQSPDTWKELLNNFAKGMLEPTSDPQGQQPTNLRQAIESSLKSPLSGLAADINALGIASLNQDDSPQLFNERLSTIVNRIDVMVALRFSPIFLETLGRDHFQDTFKVEVSEAEYRSLVTLLQTYWDVRERSFTEQGVNLNYVLNGLDVDELEDWIKNMSSMSKEEYYNRYLERIDYFAAIGHKVGGFHRVVLTLAPLSKKKKTSPSNPSAPDEGGDDTPDLEELKKLNAVTKIKLEVMRDSLSFAFSQLPDDAKRAVYNEIDPSQTEEWLKTNYFPTEITFNELNLIAQYANQMGITSPVADDEIISAGGWQNDPGVGPMQRTAQNAAESIRTAKNRIVQAQKAVAKWRKKIAKQAAQKAAQATTKSVAEVALNALGTALGIPGLGTVLVNFWYSLPKELRDVLTFMAITGPLALLGAAGAWFAGAPAWVKSMTVGGATGAGLNGFLSKFSGGGAAGPGTIAASSNIAQSATAANNAGLAAAGKASLGSQAAQLITTMHPATQAIMITLGAVGGATILNQMVRTNAFLANFPLPDEDTSINEKISKYMALEKNVAVPAPCDQATLKCPELGSGDSYEVTYTIKMTLKGEYTVAINEIKDEITAKFSKKKFEELGRPQPSSIVITKVVIPNTKSGSRSDFEELTTDPNDERNIIRPGEELLITYVETYDEKFNHSQITNIFRADFFYVDGANSGNDYVETAKSICIGDCSQEEGCWPATGRTYQGPWGRESHNLNNIGVDAYDISNPHNFTTKLKELGVPMEKLANPTKIYSPFEAQACYPPASAVYGNYVVLTTKDWVYWLGHMISRSQESGCQQVQPGDVVGIMGTTGQSGGIHLHFELRTLDGAVTVGRPEDPLGDQMPPSLNGNKPPIPWVQNAAKPASPWAKEDFVGSCYDME